MLIFLCSDDKPCKNHIIAFSGFEGEERARIRFMIEATGAKCTNYFTKHNHILVCRRLVVIMRCLHKGLKLYKIPSCACVIYYIYFTAWWDKLVQGIYDSLNLKLSRWVADSCSANQEILDLSWNLQVPILFTRACHIPSHSNMLQLTPCGRILLEKLTVVQPVKKLSTCVFHTFTVLFTRFHRHCLSCSWCNIHV